MAEQGVVVAIRLSDVHECDQPDPLCLRAEDLAKWRHLEVLLRNMYRDPPQAIRVSYLDNEDDWVQISCDEELAEAVRITQQSDNILLFQVKRLDPLITFENKQPSNQTTVPERQSPSIQTHGTTLKSIASQPLIYPHPSGAPIPATAPGSQVPLTPLIYPHSTVPSAPLEDASDLVPDGSVFQCNASGKTSFEGRSDSSSGEKFIRLKNMLSPESVGANRGAQGLNSLSSGSLWEQAASLSSKEKLKFLKDMIPSQVQQNSSSTNGEVAPHRPDETSGQDLLVEPLCPENGSLGKNMLANQDPFENVSSEHPSCGLEQAQLLQPTLTPLKATNQGATTKTPNVALEIETDGTRCGNTENIQETARPALSMVARSSHQQQPLSAEKGRIGKNVVTPPVPLPRTLQMMEGAQSGANAVAIEIPESYHGAAHKEEDVTASGGASSTSASAETGEGVPDASHHAAAYGREVKSSVDPSAVSAVTRDSRVVATQISSSHLKKKSSVKKKSDSGKPENGGGAKRKESGGKEHSIKKRPSAEKSKKDNSAVKKEEKKVKADVESGEKTVPPAPLKEEVSSEFKDIVKYMRRMKKELHSNIVKDVAKQTDKLMKKNFERSMSSDSALLREGLDRRIDAYHSGVYCDCCNCVIYGIRYKCGNCLDYDLCAKCEALPNVHDLTHVFLKLRRPVMMLGVEVPLLRENLYLSDSQLESNSEDNAEGFSCLSQKASEDIPASPISNAKDQELEKFRWYWDSFGTGHSGGSMDIESMPKLSKEDMKKVFQMLNSQDEAEDFTSPTKELLSDTEVPAKISEVPRLSLPSVEEEDQTAEEVQKEKAVPRENIECGALEADEVKFSDFSIADRESSSDYQEIDNAEDDQDDQFEEANVSVDEDFNLPEGRNASEEDSDTSDDFCVIDPPTREEFEACGMEYSSHSECIRTVPYPAKEISVSPPLVWESDSDETRSRSLCTIVKQEGMIPSSEEKAIQESMEKDHYEVQCCPNVKDENAVSSSMNSSDMPVKEADPQPMNEELAVVKENSNLVVPDEVAHKTEEGGVEVAASLQAGRCGEETIDEDYLLSMSTKERREFLSSVEALKEKTRFLEQQLNECKGSGASQAIECQKDKDVQLILKAKRKEAMRENEKLERMNMKQVADKLEKWQSAQDQLQREEIRLQREKEQKYQAHLRSINKTQEKPTEVQMDVPVSDAQTSPLLHFEGHSNVVYVQTKKDANCQTHSSVDPATQASQMLQQLTHGVSKAATTAFTTAKDVIYSLQAKQFEKKAASHSQKPVQQPAASASDEGWTPPAAVWTPPKDDFVPPKSEWTPPKSEWIPPKDDYVPPKSEWIPPKSEWIPPKTEWAPPKSDRTPLSDEKKPPSPNSYSPREDNSRPSSSRQQKKEAGRHSQDSPLNPTNCISTIPLADLTLHEELKAMQRLQEMGFANREQNRKLLQQFDGDLEKVVQSLLQEEGGEHWACYRH